MSVEIRCPDCSVMLTVPFVGEQRGLAWMEEHRRVDHPESVGVVLSSRGAMLKPLFGDEDKWDERSDSDDALNIEYPADAPQPITTTPEELQECLSTEP